MRLIVFIFILFSAQLGRAEVTRPEIAIRSTKVIEVTAGLPVQLSDLGDANFVSISIREKASHLALIEPMAVGEVKSFTSNELVRILKSKIQDDRDLSTEKWTYFVGDKIKIQAVGNRLPQNRLSTQILSVLNEKCGTCSFRLNAMNFPTLQNQQILTSVDLETSSLKIAGSFLLPVRVATNGAEKTYYVTGTVITKNKALVPGRTISMGEKIEISDVKTEEVEVRFANDAFATLEDLDSKTAARTLPSGHALMKADLKKEWVVLRGQVIRAISGNDIFEVSTTMQAEDSGSVGDQIRLKNSETQKLMSGKIIERGLVRIQ